MHFICRYNTDMYPELPEGYAYMVKETTLKNVEMGDHVHHLRISDMQWGSRMCSVSTRYYFGDAAFVFTYSITSRDSFEKMECEMRKVMTFREIDDFSRVPVVVVGLCAEQVSDRQVDAKSAQDLAVRFGLDPDQDMLEASAKTGDHVWDVFNRLCVRIDECRAPPPPSGVRRRLQAVKNKIWSRFSSKNV